MARPLSVLIVDDERLARRRLQISLSVIADVEIAGVAADGDEALEAMSAIVPDVILLDVEMPGMDGFALLEAMSRLSPPPFVIFVTAYENYAFRAFDVDATDYLLKPVEVAKLEKAIDKARAARSIRDVSDRIDQLSDIVASLRPAGRRPETARYQSEVWIPGRSGLLKVPSTAVDWIEADRDYVRLHVGEQSHLLRKTINYFETAFDPALFLRIHRSAIVRIEQIYRFRRTRSGTMEVDLKIGRTLAVGKKYAPALRKRLVSNLEELPNEDA